MKLARLLLSGLIALSLLPAMPAQAAVSGDLNGDGVCDKADVFLLRDALCGEGEVPLAAADLSGDGRLDARDLTLMKRQVPMQQETVTMMVYMVGSTLESDESLKAATLDLNEMFSAEPSAAMQTVVLAGGSATWHNDYAQDGAETEIVIGTEGVQTAPFSEDYMSMGAPETLGRFIAETAAQYPADHYALVLWGHGAGPLFGMCHDSVARDILTLNELQTGLDQGGIHFDWIGVDCCMLGALETMQAVKDHADYLVGSEIRESKNGWKYDGFMTEWAKNPSMDTKKLVTLVADEMIAGNAESEGSAQIACYDLSRTDALLHAYYAYVHDIYTKAETDGSAFVSDAFADMLDFSLSGYDIYDLWRMTELLAMPHSADVQQALKDAVTVNRVLNLYEFGGAAVWFPRDYPSDGLNYLEEMYGGIGMDAAFLAEMREICEMLLPVPAPV